MEKVYLLSLEKYNPQQISTGLQKAAQFLGISLEQKSTVLLADCPWTHPKYAPHAHTHPQFIEGVVNAFNSTKVTVTANSLPNFPTRYSFKNAGYNSIHLRSNASILPLDETITHKVTLENGKVMKEAKLPAAWLNASFRVLMPKLRQSTVVPFAGSLRQLQALLPQNEQLKDSHLLPEKMVDLLGIAPVDLIAVDAIQALHRGGEVSGQPVDLGVMIVGVNPIAVDMICAVALGLDPSNVDFLREAASRGYTPASLKQIEIIGDVSLSELRGRAAKVELVDSNPVAFHVPDQVKVIRSEKARQAGVSGMLADVLCMLKNAGVSMKSASYTSIVIGVVNEIRPGKDEYSTIIFMDDTSRGDFKGYGRIVRLSGRNIPLSQIISDVPYAMKIINLKAEFGVNMMLVELFSRLRRMLFPWKSV